MARLEFIKTVTHAWGEGKDHKRLHAAKGDKVEAATLPPDVVTYFREKGLAAYELAEAGPAEAAPPPTVGAAPTRPPGLASKVRD